MTASRDTSAPPDDAAGPRPRLAALDVVRGVAILGTFGTSVWLFTVPGGAGSLNPIITGDGFLETALPAIANGKFLALLSLLFGIGLELQYRAAVRRGLTWPGRYLRRAGILFLEGLVHYVLVFEWDILTGYAIVSVLVAYLVGRSHRAQTVWMLAIGIPYVLLLALGTALLIISAPPLPDEADPVVSTASWTDQVLNRIVGAGFYRAELILILPSSTVLFLLAIRLFRAGVFTPEATRLRSRLMLLGLGLGVPANVATAWAGPDWWLIERYVIGPLIALGLLALITHLVLTIRRPGFVQGCLAAVGRTALTCYVLQNVAASVLAYDWGLGLNTRLGDLGVAYPVLLWCAIVVLDVVFAKLWLRFRDRGPLELVAHRLA